MDAHAVSVVCCPWCDSPVVAFNLTSGGVRVTCNRVPAHDDSKVCALRPYLDGPSYTDALIQWDRICRPIARITTDGYEFTSYVPLLSAQPNGLMPHTNLVTT